MVLRSRARLRALLTSLMAMVMVTASAQHKTISRPALEDLLSGAVTITLLNEYCKTPDGFYPGTTTRIVAEGEMKTTEVAGSLFDYLKKDRESGKLFARYKDVLRLISNVRPRLITDAVTQWGAWDWTVHLDRCRMTVHDIKALDSAIVVQASLNEYADVASAGAMGNIPGWVWEAFGLQDEHRGFDVQRMTFADWQRQGKNGTPQRWWDYVGLKDSLPAAVVPDIRTSEAQMWFYYQGCLFIDMGCESLSFSQVELMNDNSLDPTHWNVVFEKLRTYADGRLNIRYLLITGHTTGMADAAGNLAFDFHCGPTRPSETGLSVDTNGGDCDITANSCGWGPAGGKLYNRSLGGRAPSGWVCESLPGLVFVDNAANSGPSAGWGTPVGTNTCNQYHFDEATWFALQDEAYRNSWLLYAASRVRRLDKNLYFAPPVKRALTYRAEWYPADYLANDPRPGILDTPKTIGGILGGDVDRAADQLHCGYGQEETIKQILAGRYLYVKRGGVELSPAPAKGWIELSLGDDVFGGDVRYRFRRARGRGRLAGKFAERSQRIDVSELPPGQYRVRVKSGGKRFDTTFNIGQ